MLPFAACLWRPGGSLLLELQPNRRSWPAKSSSSCCTFEFENTLLHLCVQPSMQSGTVSQSSSNRPTCSRVKPVRSLCCHSSRQRRCTSFLPALRQQFSQQQTWSLKQRSALSTNLPSRHSHRYLQCCQENMQLHSEASMAVHDSHVIHLLLYLV